MAERQSRIRLACAQMALISLIFVTLMATSSSGLLGKLPDFLAEPKLRRAVLSGRFFRSGGRRRPPVSLERIRPLRNRYAALQHLGARQFDRAKRRRYACPLEPMKLGDIDRHPITERVGEFRNL